MYPFIAVFLATIVAYILWFHYEFVRAFYTLCVGPAVGPPAYPLIGNGLLFINNSSAGMNFHPFYR